MKRMLLSLPLTYLAVLPGCHVLARLPYRDKITFHDNLNYSQNSLPEHGFDLYVPRNAGLALPVAIFIHGGYWRNQSRSYYTAFTGLYQNFGLALASRGIATAVMDYRLFPQATIENQYADVQTAVRYIKSLASTHGLDAQRLCLVGHSAGGQMALLLAWQKRLQLNCVVALSPILDIAHMRQSMPEKFNRELTIPHFGDGSADKLHSPLLFASKDSVRTLVLVGEADDAYLKEQALGLQKRALRENIRQFEVQFIPKLDHSDMVLVVNRTNDPISNRLAEFIHQRKAPYQTK